MSGMRYDAMMVREYTDNQGQARTFWTKIGTGFVNKDGSIGLALDAIPVPPNKIILQIPKSDEEIERMKQEKQNRGGGGGGQRRRGQGQPQRGVQPNLPRAPRQQQQTPDYPEQWDDNQGGGDGGGFPDDEGP